MRNRWYHPPTLHSPGPGEVQRVGWIELFYDLVYVATIIQLGSALSKYRGKYPTQCTDRRSHRRRPHHAARPRSQGGPRLSTAICAELDRCPLSRRGQSALGVGEENIDERLVVLTGIMTGFDGTYAQSVHARHLWYPEDLRWGERFVDVLSELDDGRLAVDYRVFHDTAPG